MESRCQGTPYFVLRTHLLDATSLPQPAHLFHSNAIMATAYEPCRWHFPAGPPGFNDDVTAFWRSHFSSEAVASFGQTFMHPFAFLGQPGPPDWAEDDGLGYYEDGVKRTLTDEQIEMFQQAELRELRKKQQNPELATTREEFATDDKECSQRSNRSSTRGTKKKKGAKVHRYEPKPDLRKRTWDVVDPGLDTLDYD